MMVWEGNVLLMTVFITVDLSSGVSLVMYGSSPAGVMNTKFTLSCTVLNFSNVYDTVFFYAKTYPGSVVEMLQDGNGCNRIEPVPLGFQAECAEGTNSNSKRNKTYNLIINNLKDKHFTDWRCFVQKNAVVSNTFSLINKNDPVTTKMKCLVYGGKSKVICQIGKQVTYDIIIWQPGGYKVVQCDLLSSVCQTFVPGYHGHVDSSTQVSVIIEQFNDVVDHGYWMCSVGKKNYISQCITNARNFKAFSSGTGSSLIQSFGLIFFISSGFVFILYLSKWVCRKNTNLAERKSDGKDKK